MSGQFLTMRLEDGETVTRLRGGRAKGLAWKSARPHAGVWGPKTHYVLVPCQTPRQATIRSKVALRTVRGLVNRSSDIEVLLLGAPEVIQGLVTQGPTWCRALTSRKGQPRTEAQQAAAAKLKAKP